MNTLTIDINGEDFNLREFFDTDRGSGVTVSDSKGIIVGEMWSLGYDIPSQEEIDSDPEEYNVIIGFIRIDVENFLITNDYY